MLHATYSRSGPQVPNGCGCIGFLSPMHKKIPDSYSKRQGGNPWKVVSRFNNNNKNSYAEHEVTGKNIRSKKGLLKMQTLVIISVTKFIQQHYLFIGSRSLTCTIRCPYFPTMKANKDTFCVGTYKHANIKYRICH